MGYEILKKGDGYQVSNMCTIMIEGSSDVANLPDNVAPGSIAYTADMSLMYMFGLDGTWHEI